MNAARHHRKAQNLQTPCGRRHRERTPWWWHAARALPKPFAARPQVRLAAAATLGVCWSLHAQPSFVPLGDLPGGPYESQAHGISASGAIVVGQGQVVLNAHEAFRWTAGTGLVGLGFIAPAPTETYAYAISGDGVTIVGMTIGPGPGQPFRWVSGVGFDVLTNAPFSAGIAHGASSAAAVIVGAGTVLSPTVTTLAFRWTLATGMQALDDLPGGNFEGAAYGVSADGQVIVGESGSALGTEAFRWTAPGGTVGLGFLPFGNTSRARAVSADGSFIVGESNSITGTYAFRWTAAAGMQSLGDLPGGFNNSLACAVNADGSVVVGQGWGDDGPEAFIWDHVNGLRSLKQVLVGEGVASLTGWKLIRGTGISADGTMICGWAQNPANQYEAFFATVPAICYPNCDGSTTPPILNVADFTCFLTRYAAGDSYANCDESTAQPVLNVADFTCFLQRYAQGCP